MDTEGQLGTLFKIQVVLDREHAIAKAHLAAGHKDRAVVALRQRKYQQGLLLRTDSQLETLEQLACLVAPSSRFEHLLISES